MDQNYNGLKTVLDMALAQASTGKGKERHATDNAFEEQPICSIQRLLIGHPFAGGAFQAIKKIIEAGRLSPEAAKREYLGAINYISSLVILTDEYFPNKTWGQHEDRN